MAAEAAASAAVVAVEDCSGSGRWSLAAVAAGGGWWQRLKVAARPDLLDKYRLA